MRKTTSALLALCALAAVAGRADDAEPAADAKAELKKLQGAWTVTKVRANGKEREPRVRLRFTFTGDKLRRVSGPDKDKEIFSETFKVKLDTKKKPHTIELIDQVRRNNRAGVYKIEKGELFLALGTPKKAPKDFKGEFEPVYVMTREKDKEKGKE
jgi:uncharacterized protein (TIGR03067 family)